MGVHGVKGQGEDGRRNFSLVTSFLKMRKNNSFDENHKHTHIPKPKNVQAGRLIFKDVYKEVLKACIIEST